MYSTRNVEVTQQVRSDARKERPVGRHLLLALVTLVAMAGHTGAPALETQLTSGTAFDRDPAWSPQGTEIAFSSDRAGDNYDIWVMSAQGEATSLRHITADPTSETHPTWAPDAAHLAFEWAPAWGERSLIACVPAHGESLSPWLLSYGGPSVGEYSPHWSPDGSEIIASTDRQGGPNIIAIDARGESLGIRWLTNNEYADFAGSWSSSGNEVCFISYRATSSTGDLWYMPSGGETEGCWQLTSGYTDQRAEWCPVDDRIAFARMGHGIMVYSFAERTVTQITNGPDHSPTWAPDGSAVAFVRDGDIWVTDNVNPVTATSWGRLKALYR